MCVSVEPPISCTAHRISFSGEGNALYSVLQCSLVWHDSFMITFARNAPLYFVVVVTSYWQRSELVHFTSAILFLNFILYILMLTINVLLCFASCNS